MIKHQHGKWVLFSKSGGRKLGTFNTEAQAKKREKEIRAASAAKESESMDIANILSQITQLTEQAQGLAEVDGSLSDVDNRIKEAFHAAYSPEDRWEGPYRTRDVFVNHVTLGNSIVVLDRVAGVNQWVEYTDTGEAVEFAGRAEWQAVELTYQFVTAASEADLLRGATKDDELSESADFALPISVLGIAENETGDGLTYIDLLPIGPGWGNGRDNHYYSEELVAEIAPMWMGAKQYATDHRQAEKSVLTEVSEIVKSPAGFTEGVADVPDGTPYARAVILRDDFAEIVKNREKAGILENLHCSILASGTARKGFEKDGKKGKLVESITQVQAVDWVTRAGARGRALAISESEEGTMTEEEKLEKKRLEEAEAATFEEDDQETQAPDADTPTFLSEADVTALIPDDLPDETRARILGRQYSDDLSAREAVTAEVNYLMAVSNSGKPLMGGNSQTAPVVPVSELAEAQGKQQAAVNQKWLGG